MNFTNETLGLCLHSGWSPKELNFHWSSSKFCTIILPVKKRKKKVGLQFIVEPFLAPGLLNEQDIQIFLNGIYAYGNTFEKPEQDIIFVEMDPSLLIFESVKVDMVFSGAKSPFSLGLSNDRRNLAFKLFEISII